MKEALELLEQRGYKLSVGTDGEVLIYKKTNIGLTNIIIDENLITYSFIANKGVKINDKLLFLEEDNMPYKP